MAKEFKPELCVLCGELITSILDSNNPWPLAEDGRCCGDCNSGLVIPARLTLALGGDVVAFGIITPKDGKDENVV